MEKILSFSQKFSQLVFKRFQLLQKVRLFGTYRNGFDSEKTHFHLNPADKVHWMKISHFAPQCSVHGYGNQRN